MVRKNFKNLICYKNNSLYDFQQFQMTRSFGDSIYARKISIDETERDKIMFQKIQWNLIIKKNNRKEK